MRTGNRNPLYLPEDEQYRSFLNTQISGKLVNTDNDEFIFPPLNSSNNFALVDYDAHINTKIDYAVNHVFKTMSVAELNALYTVCEL